MVIKVIDVLIGCSSKHLVRNDNMLSGSVSSIEAIQALMFNAA